MEKMMRENYRQPKSDKDTVGEKFTYSMALVWVQFVCNVIFAKALLIVRPPLKQDTTLTSDYAISALLYLLAMVSSNMALSWIDFSTQVVSKSAKPIPLMVLGKLIARKSYSWIRYSCVLTIVTGVVLFMYQENEDMEAALLSSPSLAPPFVGCGELLLFLSLVMEGLLGVVQDHVRSLSAPTGPQMMFATNFWGMLMLMLPIIVTGEAQEFTYFAHRHPVVCVRLAMLTICGCLGQFFLFLLISGFGSLACAVVTTTRKFFTILFSVLVMGNGLKPLQWFSMLLVFVAVFVDIFYSKTRKQCEDEERLK